MNITLELKEWLLLLSGLVVAYFGVKNKLLSKKLTQAKVDREFEITELNKLLLKKDIEALDNRVTETKEDYEKTKKEYYYSRNKPGNS